MTTQRDEAVEPTDPRLQGMLIFASDEHQTYTYARLGWTGPWPPPEVMARAIGRSTGMSNWTEWTIIEAQRTQQPDFDEHIDVTKFRQVSASALPDEVMERTTHGQDSITCPECGMTSYNPNDVREGYCGKCHEYTTDTHSHVVRLALYVPVAE